MYLSRLILNPRSRAVQHDLTDSYELHRTVMRGFPEGEVKIARTAANAAGVLFRLDEDQRSGQIFLLVQSKQQPNWSLLSADYLLPPDPFDPAGENPAVKSFAPKVQQGQRLNFRLVGNPTKRLGKSFGEDKGKRVGIYKTEEQLQWLCKKAAVSGFRILTVLPMQESVSKSRRGAKLITVRFDGVLQVIEPESFVNTVAAGIGSGKAFGCGLLSIAPAR